MISTALRGALPLWLPVWLLVAGVSIALHGPLPLYSTRTLTVAWEMWQMGDWLVPHQNGLPYSHKAPLLYWMIHAGWAVGGVSDVWPRILEVLLSTANLWLVALLARNLFPQRPLVERLAPWVLAGMLFWFLYSLQIMYDLLVAACALVSLLGLTRRDARGGFSPNWALVAVGLWLGLLAKGPVALLHLAFPLLLGPWWNDAARADRRGWYGRVAVAVLVALALFALWVVPVAILGGEVYRQDLLVTQTAGRVIAAFDHSRPPWWYLTVLPLLLFPWIFWTTTWRGLALRGEPGLRFLALWLLPTLLVFSAVSGKQAYYVLPQLAGFALWLAGVVAVRAERGASGGSALGPGLSLLAIGTLVALLPAVVARGQVHGVFVDAFAGAGPGFGVAIAGLGVILLAWRAADESTRVPRIALASLLATALLHAQFTATVWPRYDLQPAADQIARFAAQGATIANRGTYEGQFNFLARLERPIVEIDYDNGPPWAAANPDAIIIDYIHHADLRAPEPGAPQPLWSGPFRSDELQLWRAGDWLAARSGAAP
jgi:4-amino-4-deoxy-L-arabinose transferase-like glycosyltransferase